MQALLRAFAPAFVVAVAAGGCSFTREIAVSSDRPGIALQDEGGVRPLPTTMVDDVGDRSPRELTLVVDGAPRRVIVPRDSFDLLSCSEAFLGIGAIGPLLGAPVAVAVLYGLDVATATSPFSNPPIFALTFVGGPLIGAAVGGLLSTIVGAIIAPTFFSASLPNEIQVRGDVVVAGAHQLPLAPEATPVAP